MKEYLQKFNLYKDYSYVDISTSELQFPDIELIETGNESRLGKHFITLEFFDHVVSFVFTRIMGDTHVYTCIYTEFK